jgi:hypothetical protein
VEREIEIRVFERTPGENPGDYPNERDIYTHRQTIDIENDSVFDAFDKAKMEANTELMREVAEEEATQLESAYDDEDFASDHARALYYNRKFGDSL